MIIPQHGYGFHWAMCRDSVLPIDFFEGEGIQHVPHLLLCDKEAAYTIHSPILHHQLQLIGQTQFFLCFGTVLFAEIACFIFVCPP